MRCTCYAEFRKNFYGSVLSVSGEKWDFSKRSSDEVFKLIMQGTGDEFEKIIFRIFHRHLVRCFELRKTLVER